MKVRRYGTGLITRSLRLNPTRLATVAGKGRMAARRVLQGNKWVYMISASELWGYLANVPGRSRALDIHEIIDRFLSRNEELEAEVDRLRSRNEELEAEVENRNDYRAR